MTDQIPESILRTWIEIPADAWEQISEHRYRAPHRVAEFVECVVVAFGETIGRAARLDSAEDQAAVYADLFQHAGDLGARRLACHNGAPVVRPDNEANAGVVGRCWWCGRWPADHVPDGGSGQASLDTITRSAP